MANIKDVAEKAGVSTATVSHVINNTRYVSEPTKQKVIESMNELNYKPNTIARSLRSNKTKMIGFIVPDISNFFFTGLANYIEDELKTRDYSLFIGNSNESIEDEKKQITKLKSQLIDGLIVAPAVGDHSFLKSLENSKDCPIVFVDRKPEGFNGLSVLADNFNGSYQAVKYLIEKGHEKIGIITGLPGLSTTRERLNGYKKALKDYNIQINTEFIEVGDSRFNTGYELTSKLFKDKNITALYVTNNLMCVGAMEFLNKHNISIPDEIAIIGFDDYNWASITNPPLSVIKQPIEKIGRTAAKELLNLLEKDNNINKRKLTDGNEIVFDTEFIERKSC